MFVPAHSLKSMIPIEAVNVLASLVVEVLSLQPHVDDLDWQQDSFWSGVQHVTCFSALQQDETFSAAVPQHDVPSSAAVKYTFKSFLLSTIRRSARCKLVASHAPMTKIELTPKAGLLEIRFILADLTRPRDAPNIQGDIILHILSQLLPGQDVANGDSSARFEQSVHLIEHKLLLRCRNEIDDTVADDAVGCVIWQRDKSDGSFDELDVLSVGFGLIGICLFNHVLWHVVSATSKCLYRSDSHSPCSCQSQLPCQRDQPFLQL